MKILIVSLLRLGDAIQHVHFIKAVKRKYPQAEIHYLVNQEAAAVGDFVDEDVKIHLFDRNFYQRGFKERKSHPLATFKRLKLFILELNERGFDICYNLTHSTLSAYIATAVSANKKYGSRFDSTPNSLAYKYLNNISSQVAYPLFQNLDLLAWESEVTLIPMRTEKKQESYICIQMTSADRKKQLPIEIWKVAIEKLAKNRAVIILSSQQEANELFEKTRGLEVTVKACDMKEAFETIKQAELLISLDTSIAHLASLTTTPALLVYVGSANKNKILPYSEGIRLIEGSAPCFPCTPRHICEMEKPICHQKELSSIIVTEAEALINGHVSNAIIVKHNNKYIYLESESEPMDFFSFAGRIQQMVWHFYLSHQHQNQIPPFGSYVYEFLEQMQSRSQLQDLATQTRTLWMKNQILKNELDIFEQKLKEFSSSLLVPDNGFGELTKESLVGNIFSELDKISESYPEFKDDFLFIASAKNQDTDFFTLAKKMRMACNEMMQINQIREKFVKTILNEIKDRRGGYVARGISEKDSVRSI